MRYILYSLTLTLSTLLAYYVSFNLILTIIVFILLISFIVLLEYTLRKKIIPKLVKNSDLNIFLHDFLLSYIDHSEIKFCLKKANLNVSSNLKEELRLLDEYSGVAILTNLENYFSSSLYSLFLLTIKNKSEQHIENIKFVLNENTLMSKKREDVHLFNKKALWQFTVLWAISFIVLAIIRISLNNYFDKLKDSFFYILGISIYFIIFYFSLLLFAYLFYKREDVK